MSDREVMLLKKELVGLFGHLQNIRRELAAIGQPGMDDDHFGQMADLLDAIVENTEHASNTIMAAAEDIDKLVGQTKKLVKDPKAVALLDKINERGASLFEACSFQDLTGQRINKVVGSIKFVEGRVNSLIRMWGRHELEKVVEEIKAEEKPVDADKALLHGPQRTGVACDQSAVDQIFSQSDIDKLFG
ncbi:MAG: protein phosphatase CheZ [Alphaproteobacteria bacterium]|nr:protein phosphatase CheZ [Alphaproteobacteria bacterium]